MHLRLASHTARGVLIAACVVLSAPACRAGDAGEVLVESTITPPKPEVDRETTVEVRLRDRSNRPVPGATLQVGAHMNHPGMPPVIAQALEKGGGVYVARLSLPMRGAWGLFAAGSLADGRRIRRRIGDATAVGSDRGQTPAVRGLTPV